MSFVLDASALLAALLDEPGKQRVDETINGAAIVVGHFAKLGARRPEIDALPGGLPIHYVPPDEELAILAGLLRPAGEQIGLSLGDRMCFAHAKRTNATALTAERAWADFGASLGVTVELIR